jgi:signal transduction histidine kinase
LLVAGAVMLLGLLAAGLVARVATRRIGALIRVSQRMARGELDERLPERKDGRGDEIEDLALHFNRMAEALAQQRAEITAANAELSLHNEQIEKASSMKSAFLATMSHELRTPLNAIIGFTRLVLKKSGADLPQKQRENLQKVESSAVGLLAIINDILDLSKVEAGRMAVVMEAIDPAEVAREVVSALDGLARAKSLRLIAKAEEGVPGATMSDRTRLRQILTNLVSNAIKFTSAGEVVVGISFDPGTNEIVFAVRDTGIGIAEGEVERVFEPFHQVDGSTTRASGGTGLGLAIVREMSKLLGGTVSAKSRVGEGSTFTVRFAHVGASKGTTAPAAAASEQPAETPAEAKVADGI